uniref:Uncharacterized protein n=1 Tax=Anguilla anguilla TaxID=7936 RepID=A0A0E9QSX3_ANGAN
MGIEVDILCSEYAVCMHAKCMIPMHVRNIFRKSISSL